ncbi:MAG: diguanylate cyclase, partial [Clostridiales bacterium]|nr:diguanylate cyclase [Clostridiales bacterium]
IVSESGWKFEDILVDLGHRLCDLHHQDFLIQCKGVQDILDAHRDGRVAWVPVLEGAAPIENELDRIDMLYGLGIRMMGITYSESNQLGSGCKEDGDGGLTAFGRQAVRRMNEVGMLIDCSHTGPKTTLMTVDRSDAPLILSHVGAKALWPSKRLTGDDVLKAVARAGGVIGIEAAPHTTMTGTKMTHDLDSYMEHFEYIANLVGIDHVSFGTDGLYGDHVALHRAFSESLSTGETRSKVQEYREVPFVRGLENPTEASWNILRWLVLHGYGEGDIMKVIGRNALRVLRKVWR